MAKSGNPLSLSNFCLSISKNAICINNVEKKVVAGDGFIIANIFNQQKEEIRLPGIDAPELIKGDEES